MSESRKPPVSRLQELIRTRLAALGEHGKPMSQREAARRSREAFSAENLSAILRGDHGGGLTDRVAQGLAEALEVSVDEIYEAANVPRPEGRWQPPPRLDRLTRTQRRMLENLGDALLEAYEKGRRGES